MSSHSHGSGIEEEMGFFCKDWGRSYFPEYISSILQDDLLHLMGFGAGVGISQGSRQEPLGRLM